MRTQLPKSFEETICNNDNRSNFDKTTKTTVPFLFREYEKYNEQFYATNKYFLSEEIDDGKIVFIGFDFSVIQNLKESEDNNWMVPFLKSMSNKKFVVEEILPHATMKNVYYSKSRTQNSSTENPYLNLITIQNISFSYDEHTLQQKDIIKRFLSNDQQIDDSFLEDTYYNESFSKKIELSLPEDTKQYLTIDVSKRYLFRVHAVELDRELGEENYYYLE